MSEESKLIELPAESFSRRDVPAIAQPSAVTPMSMLAVAVQKGMDPSTIRDLLQLQKEWEANEARKSFVLAMAEFKSDPIEIIKDAHVEFKTDKGVTAYNHASIGNVVDKIVAGLARHGFSHRWVPKRGEGGMISITCVITHKLGHSEETTLEAGLDTSGGKNNIQAMISTTTYLERHSLLAGTGLATKEQPDDDGRGSEKKAGLSDEEIAHWTKMIEEKTTKEDAKASWVTANKACSMAGDLAAAKMLKQCLLDHAQFIDSAKEAK